MGRIGYKKWSALVALCLIVSCAKDSGTVGNTEVQIGTPSDDKVVCTPFDGADPSLANNGLKGNLLYLSDDQPRYSNMADIINNAHKVDVSLYLNKLYTPTRAFDLGFVTKSGILVTNQNGNTLYEYFALHMESNIQLRDSDPEGDYQIAILADDGAMLYADTGEGYTTLVNNDGTHPTKMACATRAVHLDRNTKIPIKLDYYQGPRYHIALTMIWRPMPQGSAANDPLCARQGNSLFWDSTQIPSAETGFSDLLDRGWVPMASQNFLLPGSENPCAPKPSPIEISNFSVFDVQSTGATVSWDTNIPANSTVSYRIFMPDGEQPWTTVTNEDMVTSHSMTITGLRAFTLYEVYITSAANGATASNSTSTFRTLR